MTKQFKLTALVLAALASTTAMAAEGYLTSEQSGKVVRNNYGECWKVSTFGQPAAQLPECGDAPAVVETQAPVAVPAPAPAPAVREEVVVIPAQDGAVPLFAFDKAVLTSAATGKLQNLLAKVNGKNVVAVQVNGYTDYMGSAAYNQKLSEKRAQSVANYLTANGVPASLLQVAGFGSSKAERTEVCKAEVAKLGKVSAKQKRAELISCLAPDRRVDVVIRYQEQQVRRVQVH